MRCELVRLLSLCVVDVLLNPGVDFARCYRFDAMLGIVVIVVSNFESNLSVMLLRRLFTQKMFSVFGSVIHSGYHYQRSLYKRFRDTALHWLTSCCQSRIKISGESRFALKVVESTGTQS